MLHVLEMNVTVWCIWSKNTQHPQFVSEHHITLTLMLCLITEIQTYFYCYHSFEKLTDCLSKNNLMFNFSDGCGLYCNLKCNCSLCSKDSNIKPCLLCFTASCCLVKHLIYTSCEWMRACRISVKMWPLWLGYLIFRNIMFLVVPLC